MTGILWIDCWTDGNFGGQMNSWLGGWNDEWINRWVGFWLVGWSDVWMFWTDGRVVLWNHG
jgi:hypothetical protein